MQNHLDIIGEFRNVFHAYSVNKRLFLTIAKLVGGLPDLAITHVCKVNTSYTAYPKKSGTADFQYHAGQKCHIF